MKWCPFFLFYNRIGPWGTWCCQLEGAWRIYKSEKYSNDWTWKIWDWNMVFLPLSSRIQWHHETLFLWVLSQFHEAQGTAPETYGEMCSKFCRVAYEWEWTSMFVNRILNCYFGPYANPSSVDCWYCFWNINLIFVEECTSCIFSLFHVSDHTNHLNFCALSM